MKEETQNKHTAAVTEKELQETGFEIQTEKEYVIIVTPEEGGISR